MWPRRRERERDGGREVGKKERREERKREEGERRDEARRKKKRGKGRVGRGTSDSLSLPFHADPPNHVRSLRWKAARDPIYLSELEVKSSL